MMAVGTQVGEGVIAVGETVMELPVQVTAGVMSMNENPEAEEQQAEAERQARMGSFRRSTEPDDGSLFGFVGPEATPALI